MSEFMRSRLGIATTESENQLDDVTVLSRCTEDHSQMVSVGETSMGVDIGKVIHVVIGIRTSQDTYDILNVSRVSDLHQLHDLAQKMNVKSAVIDSGPHDHGVREFQKTEPYTVYLCQYSETQPGKPNFNAKDGMVKVNRNEWCDKVHDTFTNNKIRIPRKSPEVIEFASELTKTAKTFIENPDTGLRKPRWIKIGADHYFHAVLYYMLAANRTTPRARHQEKVNRPQYVTSNWN
jgi:hypothetical protein